MSQSQASESQTSFYAESFLDPNLLQPDDPFELPSSQPTVSSIPISDFTYSLRYSDAPTSLTRVGPTLQRFWVLYNADKGMEVSRKQFVDWWLTTDFGLRKELQTTIRWDGKKKSDIWERFDQVAHQKTCEPKVMSLVVPHAPPNKIFSQNVFEEKLLEFITSAPLLFRIIEQTQFKDLLDMVQSASSRLNIPSARSIRRRLEMSVEKQHQSVLSKLPEGSRLAIALDCWTSPFNQAFMAITGYFLDENWNYMEVLLGFEPLHGSHTGGNLSKTVIQILQQHSVANRVSSITTDNASNNNTMITGVQEIVQSLGLSNNSILRVPCIAHVIQLSLNQHLGRMIAKPVNQEVETEWSDKRTRSLQSR
ncbi:hypothetical protein N7474_009001 [Penicillium riverlandense]|uniref:uncharacterized protein n=1 Tax=Penicillium riverlandense TaxID=1903569 RepID=UPI002548C619|nr:uncharacterized protein N7474_009001 [Penicillium riverlandense]KAJ5807732.1 hypothetical protein N7474_009001 [Penicillium riverlandense]